MIIQNKLENNETEEISLVTSTSGGTLHTTGMDVHYKSATFQQQRRRVRVRHGCRWQQPEHEKTITWTFHQPVVLFFLIVLQLRMLMVTNS